MNNIAEIMKAPSIRYAMQCVGPLEHERPAYIKARDYYEAAKLKGDALAEAEAAAKLQSFELEEKWSGVSENLVMTAGKTDIVDKYLKGSSYTADWYLGLKGTGTIDASDTLASHSGWSEETPYSGDRPAVTWGTTSGGSNTATAVSITITATATVAGAFIATVDTGSSGVLYSCSNFAAPRGVANGDTLNVTPTISVS
jgi:hypothetical protein